MPMAVAAIAPSMILECEEYGLPEPELIDFDGDFRVNMFRKPAEKDWSHNDNTKQDTNDTISKHDTIVLRLIRENLSIFTVFMVFSLFGSILNRYEAAESIEKYSRQP